MSQLDIILFTNWLLVFVSIKQWLKMADLRILLYFCGSSCRGFRRFWLQQNGILVIFLGRI